MFLELADGFRDFLAHGSEQLVSDVDLSVASPHPSTHITSGPAVLMLVSTIPLPKDSSRWWRWRHQPVALVEPRAMRSAMSVDAVPMPEFMRFT